MGIRSVDVEILDKFEEGLDTINPYKSRIPLNILGYGEISTVFEILHSDLEGLAFKRLPIFRDRRSAEDYIELHKRYNDLLGEVGLETPEYGAKIVERKDGIVVLYIYQEKLPPETICNKAIHLLRQEESIRLYTEIVNLLKRVFDYNKRMDGRVAIGIDGQISNWAIKNYDGDEGLPENLELYYFDTTTPLIRIEGGSS